MLQKNKTALSASTVSTTKKWALDRQRQSRHKICWWIYKWESTQMKEWYLRVATEEWKRLHCRANHSVRNRYGIQTNELEWTLFHLMTEKKFWKTVSKCDYQPQKKDAAVDPSLLYQLHTWLVSWYRFHCGAMSHRNWILPQLL